VVRKALALAIVALSMAFVPFAPQAANAAAYGPKLPTQTNIEVVTAVNGQQLVFRLSDSASDGTSPAGTINYTIVRNGGAGQVVVGRATSSAVQVNGHAVLVKGSVARPGSYLVSAHFSPTNAARYLPSSNVNRAGVGTAIHQGSGGGSTGTTGGLPNTGGPSIGWLLAGLALLGSGLGAVAYSRRRTPQAA